MNGTSASAFPDPAALDALEEGGAGLRFSAMLGVPAVSVVAFAVRHGGQVHAWVNRCPHRGTELDWMPGEFFDDDRQHLVCATHGALFRPDTGLCVAGPCTGQGLQRVQLPGHETAGG